MAEVQAARPTSGALKTLIDFYDPATRAPDSRGRTLAQILAWSDSRLESCHDYIQILFPLPEGSIFNYVAPVIDEPTFLYLRTTSTGRNVQRNVRRAFKRIMAFYGFRTTWESADEPAAASSEVVLEEEEGCERSFARWVCPMDHNHLRITRILRSLRTLGLEDEAVAFFDALERTRERYGRISKQSFKFWKRAVELPLYQAPDGDMVDWLEKYDMEESEEE